MNNSIRLAVDAVLFGYDRSSGISLLLVKRRYDPFKGAWVLPGGFVGTNESLEDAVKRELQEETGVKLNFLEQLYSFGDPERDPRYRVVSVAYFGLVRHSLFKDLKASTDAAEAQWFSIDRLPALAFDHRKIVSVAVDRLRKKARYEPIGFELLDKSFPFSDLEKLYMALLGTELNRRNFSKKMLSFDFLTDTGVFSKPVGKGRPSKMYQFNARRYKELQREGFHFEI